MSGNQTCCVPGSGTCLENRPKETGDCV